MTGQPTLLELVDLATAFNEAVANKAKTDPALLGRINSSMTAADEQTLSGLAGEIQNSVIEAMLNPPADAAAEHALENKIAGSALQLCEAFTSVVSRTESDNDLSAFVPAAARTFDISTAFLTHQAPTLARLFAPKTP